MDANITQLAQSISLFLTPYLPYLIRGIKEIGKGAAEKLGEEFTSSGLKQAKAIYGKLAKKREVAQAAKQALKMPEDADASAAFRLQIKLLLVNDPALAAELAETMQKIAVHTTVTTGDVLPGGSVTGIAAKELAPGEYDSQVKTRDVGGDVTGLKIGD